MLQFRTKEPICLDAGLVADLFAGGGGASTGIEAALGRPVDIALNHDAIAILAHERNHPQTKHVIRDVWRVKPTSMTKGRPVFMLWASPDCRHFSNAKGDVPRSKKIRSLANAVVRWALEVRPSIIFVENVREFLGWGPLCKKTRKPIEARKGESFGRWKKGLERLGYVVEWRILDASHYGAPTRRKRLFVIARCDGKPIEWPAPTHGPGLLPFRTAAECIDWSLACPSIFGRKKPLAEKTMWRIAQGIRRFVLENPNPFVMKVNHGKREDRSAPIFEPLTTVTATQRGHALVVPHLTKFQENSVGQDAQEPIDTVMAGAQRFGMVVPTLQQSGFGERKGQRARVPGIDVPLGTIMAGGQKHALVAAFLAKHYGDPKRKKGGGVVIGSDAATPIGTVTTRDHHSVVSAVLVEPGQRHGRGQKDAGDPLSTVVAKDRHALAAVALAKMRGTNNGAHPGGSVEEPLPTISAGGDKAGRHVAQVVAFLTTYYGSDGTSGQNLDEPARTIRTKHCLGLVTVQGVEYQIVDIGFRMLEPHELLRAQFGKFADGYDLTVAKTKAAKIRLIGNSVPPEMVEALVSANAPAPVRVAA